MPFLSFFLHHFKTILHLFLPPFLLSLSTLQLESSQMLNHLNLDLVLSLLRPLFLPFNLKLLRRPFLDLLLDLLHNYCCLFFGVFLLNLLENLQSFMALFPI
jgi:hypothetical protein